MKRKYDDRYVRPRKLPEGVSAKWEKLMVQVFGKRKETKE